MTLVPNEPPCLDFFCSASDLSVMRPFLCWVKTQPRQGS